MLRFLSLVLLTLLFATFLSPVYAQRPKSNAEGDADVFTIEQPAGIPVSPGGSAEGIVGTILKNITALFFVVGGIGVVIYFLWGAVEWIFSGGDKEKVSNARKRMTHAIIGLVLLSLSYVIINLVGNIAGFNPLGQLQIPGLGGTNTPIIGKPTVPAKP